MAQKVTKNGVAPPQPLKRVSEVMPRRVSSGLPRVTLGEILENEVVIWEVAEKVGDYGVYLTVKLSTVSDTQPIWETITGGKVLVEKLRYLNERKLLPVIGTFTHPGTYYDLV